jgi:hypothetical protein
MEVEKHVLMAHATPPGFQRSNLSGLGVLEVNRTRDKIAQASYT